MKNSIRILPALAMLLCLTLPAKAEVTVSSSESYYTVKGTTPGQIMAVFKHRKDNYAATTQPKFNYKYSWVQKGNLCSTTNVDVHLHLHYTYPRLTQKLAKYNQIWWENTLKNMIVHEEIHGKIAKKAAHELERNLMKVTKVPCSTIKNMIRAHANRIFQDHERRQREYDRITEHGIKQELYRDQ